MKLNKKIYTIIGIIFLLTGLTGCTEETENEFVNENQDVELIVYSVTTHWFDGEKVWSEGDGHQAHDGFYHDFPSNAVNIGYSVKGTIKNNAGKFLDRIIITAAFYDSNDNVIFETDGHVFNLPNSYTDTFSVGVDDFFIQIDLMKQIVKVKFSIQTATY